MINNLKSLLKLLGSVLNQFVYRKLTLHRILSVWHLDKPKKNWTFEVKQPKACGKLVFVFVLPSFWHSCCLEMMCYTSTSVGHAYWYLQVTVNLVIHLLLNLPCLYRGTWTLRLKQLVIFSSASLLFRLIIIGIGLEPLTLGLLILL